MPEDGGQDLRITIEDPSHAIKPPRPRLFFPIFRHTLSALSPSLPPLLSFSFSMSSLGMDSKETLAAIVLGRQLSDDFLLIGPTILCYDHLLTLRSEIHFVWGKPKRLSSFLFVALRYVCLLSNIGMVGLRFGPVPLEVEPQSTNISSSQLCLRCHAMFLTNTVLLILQNVLVGNILGLRVYVMYNFSKLVLLFLIGTGVVTVALAAWSISGETWVATQTSGCEFQLPKGSAIRKSTHKESPTRLELLSLAGMAGAWEAQLFCDVVVFVFTVIRSYNQPFKIRGSILIYMLRDGALYFAILAFVNLGNILMFYASNFSSRERCDY
ncbi:hypothetical protein B0H13DRAFT_2311620 [Mycena leptocephala]|nr:hypothetical protein B0H13DRAFT_2311620 [Mycena leptocephala]